MTGRPIKTLLTEDQEHALNEAALKARKGSVFVKVDKEALQNLLIDHGKLVAAAPDGIETPEGKHV